MNDTIIDRILDNMFQVLPVFHKKLLRRDLGGVTDNNVTRLHFAVMGILGEGSKTVSELARALVIPKPQMTHIINQLVKNGIVERHPGQNDRRVIVLEITAEGRALMETMKSKVKENVKDKLSVLTSDELQDMAGALETLLRIGARL